MKNNYDKAFIILCQLEGYSSNLKGDTGGRTIWGITEKWFPDDIKAMSVMDETQSREYAKVFYIREFWSKLGCDALPYPLDIVAFCQGVNSLAAAKKILAETTDWKDYLFKFQVYYSKLVDAKPANRDFFRGWINRTLSLWIKLK